MGGTTGPTRDRCGKRLLGMLGIYQALRYSGGGEGEGNSDDRWKCVIPSIKTFHII